MDTLNYILTKFDINADFNEVKMPIEISRFGRGTLEIPNNGKGNLATLFGELNFKVGVEIGTERGGYAKILCEGNPGVKLFCIDPWLAYKDYTDHTRQGKINSYYDIAVQTLEPYNCTIIKKFSMDALKDFEDNSLDFVYIDGNHRFEYVVEDFSWIKKVRPGGIISGHDFKMYKNQRNNHVVEAVVGYTASYHIVPWFVLGKGRDRVRDICRSFMWVKKE